MNWDSLLSKLFWFALGCVIASYTADFTAIDSCIKEQKLYVGNAVYTCVLQPKEGQDGQAARR